MSAARRELTNGPGKLCQAFAIERRHNAVDLVSSALFLSDGPRSKVERATRVGIDYAGAWAARPWRFFDPSSRYVSTRKGAAPSRTGAASS
jgi:DNA-3-methyladenine glycosylase